MAADEPDLSGLLLAHRVFRTEFGRLADALAAPRDDRHATLLANRVDRVCRLLHLHHTVEDEVVWPALRTLSPECGPALDRLEEQHEAIDPLLVDGTDRRLPPRQRAAALGELHALLGTHLDEEEAVTVPLLRSVVSAAQHQQWERDTLARMGAREQLAVAALVVSHADAAERADIEAGTPACVRALFRWFVEPSYARRTRTLYGSG